MTPTWCRYEVGVARSTMPANVEVKARLADRDKAVAVAKELSGNEGSLLKQEDTFFVVPNGRLKLRVEEGNVPQLIHYHRADATGPTLSQYTIATTETPQELKAILSSTMGELGRVRKWRLLFQVGQTRIHIDSVEGLGDFLELEVVLRAQQSVSEGETIANDVMSKLGVSPNQLISCAYMDLILQQKCVS